MTRNILHKGARWLLAAVILGVTPLLSQIPLTGEFPVMEGDFRRKEDPAVCMDARGRSMVVWSAIGAEFGYDVWSRSYLSSGAPRTDPELLTVPFGEAGDEPRCTVDSQGSGAAIWGTPNLAANSVSGVQVHDLRPDFDQPLEPEPGSGSSIASIIKLSDGSFLASWTNSSESPVRLVARRLGSAGEVLGTIDPVAAGYILGVRYGRPYVRAAPLRNGTFVLVWTGVTSREDDYDVWARIWTAELEPRTEPFIVTVETDNDQFDPDVSSNGDDLFVVTWDSLEQDGSGEGVYGRRFNADGVALGGEFQISSEAFSSQWGPSVSMDRNGGFAVSFNSVQEDIDLREDVFLRQYDNQGAPIGAQRMVNELILGEQQYTSTALSDSGLLAVVWQSYQMHEGGEYDEEAMVRLFVSPCLQSEHTLCLQGGRFMVRAFWRAYDGSRGTGHTIPLTTDSGGFWFFGPDNFELLVKVLDGCGVNGNFWLYAAGLTDVEVDLVVTDSWSGMTELFPNVLGQPFVPIQEVGRYPSCGVVNPHAVQSAPTSSALDTRMPTARAATILAGSCQSAEDVLCLGNGRFRVTVTWEDFAGNTGAGHPIPTGEDSGLFWFFWSENLEIALKVLDGCGVNQRYWVYTAGLTNVAVNILVEDLATGAEWSHSNALGQPFGPVLDSSALATCP